MKNKLCILVMGFTSTRLNLARVCSFFLLGDVMKNLASIDRLNIGYIYAIGFPNGRVKVGRSINPIIRMRAICSQSGYSYDDDVNKFYIETAQHAKVESKCHKNLSEISNRLAGEFFDCSFDEAVRVIKSQIITYTEDQLEDDRRIEKANTKAFVDGIKRIVTGSSSLFDQLNIGGDFRGELLELFEPYGGKDFYDDKNIELRCSSIVFITDKGVYDTRPNGCDYYETIEGFLENHELTKNEVADDLGIDVCDLAHPLDFSVDIRSAEHVVQAIGVIGGVSYEQARCL